MFSVRSPCARVEQKASGVSSCSGAFVTHRPGPGHLGAYRILELPFAPGSAYHPPSQGSSADGAEVYERHLTCRLSQTILLI